MAIMQENAGKWGVLKVSLQEVLQEETTPILSFRVYLSPVVDLGARSAINIPATLYCRKNEGPKKSLICQNNHNLLLCGMDELWRLMKEYLELHPEEVEHTSCFMYTAGEDQTIEMLKNANGRKVRVEYPSVEILDGGVLVYVE